MKEISPPIAATSLRFGIETRARIDLSVVPGESAAFALGTEIIQHLLKV